MERISIFNYEAFYLDFLEGNLSEEDTSLLLAFLKLHPELEVEMDDLPVIENSIHKVDSLFLDSLKQTDLLADVITASNSESFMIASFEGQLSEGKEEELLVLLNANPALAAEFAQIQKLKLTADSSIVYPDKGALIQRKKIVLWPYVAAAASVLIFLFIYQGFQSTNRKNIDLTAQSKSVKKIAPSNKGERELLEKSLDNQKTLNEIEPTNSIAFNGNSLKNQVEDKKPDSKENFVKNSVVPINNVPKKQDLEIANIDRKDAQVNKAKSPEFIEVVPKQNDEVAQANQTKKADISNAGMNSSANSMQQMKNPIKPITNRLSELTKTEIDVRTAQGNTNKRKGFYLKIGKFEIERKGN